MDDQKGSMVSKNRLEALVEGIFAFAMTLLVTGLTVPTLSKQDAHAKFIKVLAEMRSEFTSFLIAFFVLASFWQIHNRYFRFVRTVDSGIIMTTLLILVCVVLMPFTTNMSGRYSYVQAAVDIFHINMFCLGLFFFIQWWYLARHPDITSAEISGRDASLGMARALIIPVISAVGFILSYISPSWSMSTYFLTIPCIAMAKRFSH